jgi:hypothetical protein
MKQNTIALLLFCIIIKCSFAQTEHFHIATYTLPKGWKKEVKENVASLSSTNKTNKSWCQAGIYKTVESKGSIEQDFNSEWQALIVPAYKPTGTPQLTDLPETSGWKIKSGGAKFIFNNKDAVAMLTVFSGYGKVVSVVSATNHADYITDLQQLIGSIKLSIPDSVETAKSDLPASNPGTVNSKGSFSFSSSNFDDGWVAIEKTDWVEVTKGEVKVLIHYANAVTNKYIPDRDEATKTAWNNLVAPRYNNLKNYFVFNNSLDPEAPFLASADATENSTGKSVYVVLFKRGKSNCIEFICPNRNSFIKNFGVDQTKLEFYTTFEYWEPLKKMAGYNKFAISNADFTGKWTNDFTGIQQYVNIYTGFDAGMSTYQTRQNFEFNTGNSYKWDLTVASGMVGAIKGKTIKASGKFSVASNWQMHFSDISGKPAVYDAYFSCVKSGRVLWLSDISYPGYTAFGKLD